MLTTKQIFRFNVAIFFFSFITNKTLIGIASKNGLHFWAPLCIDSDDIMIWHVYEKRFLFGV